MKGQSDLPCIGADLRSFAVFKGAGREILQMVYPVATVNEECENKALEILASTLDERFRELRSAVDDEVARARRTLLEDLSRALCRLQAVENEKERGRVVAEESAHVFAGEPLALELLEKFAALAGLPKKSASVLDQDLPLRAQRFARVKVAEIQLYDATAVKRGRAARDLYGTLKPQIDAAREAFRERFLMAGQHVADYLHTELVRTLANDDAELLGPSYPGALG
jgi:hypothetical protein